MADAKDVHPNAPAGGGGPGVFRSALPAGLNPDIDKWGGPARLGRRPVFVAAGFLPALTIDLLTLPRIMRNQSPPWMVAATLMEEWFAAPANDDSLKGTPDTTSIKMDDWVLKFARAKKVYDQMLADRIYANGPGQREIRKMLDRKGLLNNKVQRKQDTFGDFTQPVSNIDADYINERPVSNTWWEKATDPMDDMYGALGAFNLRVAVSGVVAHEATKAGTVHRVSIAKVGVYVRDSYDFGGDQPLGWWDPTFNRIERYHIDPLAYFVSNRDFRDWRKSHNKGGDFLVFSNLKVTTLGVPVSFEVSNI
jgi:Family of unknown function (DUF6402)